MFDLVRAETKDGLLLRGLYVGGDRSKAAVIHIHGFQGDFFTQEFVKRIAEKLGENNIGFVSVQNRGTGIESELYLNTPGYGKTIGSSYELLEEAYIDIDAWIEFLLNEGYSEVILQGHSLGTMKVTRYLFEGEYKDKIKKLILLAPFDIIYLLKSSTNGNFEDYLKIAQEKVSEGKGREIIPEHFLDARMAYQTYLSHHRKDDFGYAFALHDKNYNLALLNKIQIPVKIIVGTLDPYFYPSDPNNSQEAMDTLLKNIKSSQGKLITGAKHGYEGYEDQLASEVLSFVNS